MRDLRFPPRGSWSFRSSSMLLLGPWRWDGQGVTETSVTTTNPSPHNIPEERRPEYSVAWEMNTWGGGKYTFFVERLHSSCRIYIASNEVGRCEVWSSHGRQWSMTPCSLLRRSQRFGGIRCLRCLKGIGKTFVWNFCVPVYQTTRRHAKFYAITAVFLGVTFSRYKHNDEAPLLYHPDSN